MTLKEIFNKNYLRVHEILHESFNEDLEEDRLLSQEVKRLKTAYEADNANDAFYKDFHGSTESLKEAIFAHDETLFTESKVEFLARFKFDRIWARCADAEKKVFWNNLISLLRYSAMLTACGESLGDMEGMAKDFMKTAKGLKPEEYHMALFKEMLGGGDMSKKLIKTFQDPGAIKNILSNVSTIMRNPDGDGGGVAADFNDILKLTSDFSDADLAEVQKGVIGKLSEGM